MNTTFYDELYVLHKDREDFHRQEKSLTLRMKARLRRVCSRTCENHDFKCKSCTDAANALFKSKDPRHINLNHTFLIAQEPIREFRKKAEKQMVDLVATHPLAAFVTRTRGFGLLGLALILAETGDLRNYDNPGKVWKRMGVAVGADGRAQRRVAGCGKRTCKVTCDKCQEAVAQGFSPTRRAIIWNAGDSLVKQGDELRQVYLQRKEYEREKAPDKPAVLHHKRAQRYMEKRLLRELWREAQTLAA